MLPLLYAYDGKENINFLFIMSDSPNFLQEIMDNFALLSDWHDKYAYLIELGNQLPQFQQADMIDENKVQGCVSQVWLVAKPQADGTFIFSATSDAHIVRGLIAIVLALFNGKAGDEIANTDEKEIFTKIGLQEHLTPQRNNGLRSLVERLRVLSR